MINKYLFVSCDIIAHSSEPSILRQRDNITAINAIVKQVFVHADDYPIIWASGGDGGHLAFPVQSNVNRAIELIGQLRLWSIHSGVNLRITANTGITESFQGADGRTQLVGPGINLAGRLLAFGDQSRVIMSSDVLKHCAIANNQHYFTHDARFIKPPNFPEIKVLLFSAKNQFTSTWNTKVSSINHNAFRVRRSSAA